jgi:hypothetical protein
LALVAVLYIGYDATRGLRHGNLTTAIGNGANILHFEHLLHLAPEHALNHLLFEVPALAVVSAYYYATLHFIVTPAVLVWLYRRHPGNYRDARTTVALGTAIALLVYWVFPAAPPRLLPGNTFHDTLANVHQWGWWGGDGSVPRGLGSLTNQLAAMPSLHVGWALWAGWLIARHATRRSVRVLGAAYPVTTALVVMATGNHYLFDALGGAAVIALGGMLTLGLNRLRGARNGLPEPTLTEPISPATPAGAEGSGTPAAFRHGRRCRTRRRTGRVPYRRVRRSYRYGRARPG